MAALISSVMSTKDKVPFFVARCEEMGIEILPARREPVRSRVHRRRAATSASASTRSRASATRRSRRSSARGRTAGRSRSLWDFCERVDARTVNKKAIEALIKCGALGSTGATRRGMLTVLEQAQAAGQKTQQDALIGQASIFDLGDAQAGAGAARRASAARAPADPGRGVRAARAARGREGGDRPVRLRASAEAVREALRARVDCPIAALADRARQGRRDGRRDHHRGEADPHAQRRPR